DIRLATGSPVWISSLVTLDAPTNLLSFEYTFSSQAEGWLSVYFDGQLIFNADERVFGAVTQSEAMWLGQDYLAGSYNLAFRLDPYSATQSVVDVSNVSFGFVPEPGSAVIVGLVLGILFLKRRYRSVASPHYMPEK